MLADRLEVGQWVQAEVTGPGVQANPLKLPTLRIIIFGFGSFDAGSPTRATTNRIPMDGWPAWAVELSAPAYAFPLPATIGEAITQVETLKSLLNPARDAEGVVWTQVDGAGLPGLGGRSVWKSISARYLTKHGG